MINRFISGWKAGVYVIFLVCAGLTGCSRRNMEFVPESETEAGIQKEPSVTPEPTGVPEPEKLYVDVRGAVKNPGVFVLDSGSRVFEAVEAAGGLLPEAASAYVNQAQLLEDGQQIYVPTPEETKQSGLQPGVQAEAGDEPEESSMVNINRAMEEQLTTLPGIGASKAQDIIAYREENGGFSTTEELMNVPGIKEGTFDKIKDKIAVE